jgi:hypothetical protein
MNRKSGDRLPPTSPAAAAQRCVACSGWQLLVSSTCAIQSRLLMTGSRPGQWRWLPERAEGTVQVWIGSVSRRCLRPAWVPIVHPSASVRLRSVQA